jgi:hypothetical protein
MKSNRPSFFIYGCIVLLMTLAASPSHAIPMRITGGNITLGSDDPIAITGYVDLIAPDAFSMFTGIRTDISLDGYAFMPSIIWEGGPPSEEPVLELYYSSGGATYRATSAGNGFGYVDYIAESYNPDIRGVVVESWEALQFNIRFSNYADIGPVSLSLSAAAQVPEPGTITLLGVGLIGLVGASRKRFKRR